MRVKFKFPWFGPDSHYYDPRMLDEHEVPDEYRDVLPATAVVLGEENDESLVPDEPKPKKTRKPKPKVEKEPEEDPALAALLEAQKQAQSGTQKLRDAENAEADKVNARAKAARVRAAKQE